MFRMLFWTVLLSFSLLPVSYAWLPPSFHIIQSLAKKHEPLNAGRFQHRISVFKPSGEVFRTFTETLIITETDQALVKLADEANNEVATRSRRLIGGKNNDFSRPALYDLLVVKDQTSVFDHLKALGLPLKSQAEVYSEKDGDRPYRAETHIALLRHEGRVALVSGDLSSAKKGDFGNSSDPQLWVERNSYVPLRAVFPAVSENDKLSDALDLRFSGYQPYQKGFLYPRTTLVYVDERPWLRIETLDVRLGDGKPFEQSKTKPQLAADVQEFVEKYFQWIR